VRSLRVAVLVLAAAACKKGSDKPAPRAQADAAPVAAAPAADAAASAAEGPLAAGNLAPDFTVPAHDGTKVSLRGLRGGPVVLYFYPKDDTPG
jgi:cytochrome oxidase Cu insertion factor (SCO1/SenC/PrrC family)